MSSWVGIQLTAPVAILDDLISTSTAVRFTKQIGQLLTILVEFLWPYDGESGGTLRRSSRTWKISSSSKLHPWGTEKIRM